MSGITGVNSYPPTVELFDLHWTQVDAAMSPDGLVLPDGTTHMDFMQMKLVMNSNFSFVRDGGMAQRQAAAALSMARHKLQPRIVQFGQVVRLNLSQTQYANAAPKAPDLNGSKEAYDDAIAQIKMKWAAINVAPDLAPFVPPLTLPDFSTPPAGPYTLAKFQTEAGLLMDLFGADQRAGIAATQWRAGRDQLLPPIYAAMKTYREACLLLLPPTSPLLATLPRLTPVPGSTPPGLLVSGAWNNTLNKAVFTWPQSTFANLDKLQVRGVTGGSWKGEDEEIVQDLPPTATEYETDWGLTAPGSLATFKIYVMATTGNENGGKAVKIVRPDV